MSTALSLTPTFEATATEATTDAAAILDATRNLVDSVNTSLESSEGAGRTEVAKALAEVLKAVAKRIEG